MCNGNAELNSDYSDKCVESIDLLPKSCNDMVKTYSRLQHSNMAHEIISVSSKKIPR